MKLNFNSVKNDFFTEMKKNGEIEKWRNISKLNIFDYVDKFQEYIEKNYSQDDVKDNISLFKNISNVKLNSTASKASIESEDEDDEFAVDFLNNMLKDDKFRDLLDENGDSKIDDEELSAYLEAISSLDDEKDDISIKDLITGVSKLKSGELEMEVQRAVETPFSSDSENASRTITPSQGGSFANPTGSAGGSVGGSGIPAANAAQGGYESMSLETLKEQQSTYNEQQKKGYEDLENVYNGTNDKVQGAQTEVDEAQKEYKEALGFEEGDESYKEGNSNQAKIAQKTDETAEKQNEFNKSQIELSQVKNQISLTQSQIGEVEATISGLESAKSANDASIAKIQEQINSASENTDTTSLQKTLINLQDKQKEINNEQPVQQAKLEELQKTLKEKQDKEKELNTKIETLTDKIGDLQTDINDLQEELFETLDEEEKEKINTAKERYDNALKNLKSTQEEQAKIAQTNIDNAVKELDKLQPIIEEKTKNETQSDYTVRVAGSLSDDVVKALDGKLGSGFCAKVEELAEKLHCAPEDLLMVMSVESGISPTAVNPNGGATGLIQFMPSTAAGLGTSTAALRNMSAVQQMEWVDKYLTQNKNAVYGADAEIDAGDLYALVFLPGYAKNETLCSAGSIYYSSNSGLDIDGDGRITKTDLYNISHNKYASLMSSYGVSV